MEGLSKIKQIICGDISYDQKYVFIGGVSKSDKAQMVCIKLSKSFKCLKSQEFDENEGQINTIKRIPGTDVVMCGIKKGVMGLTFKEKSEFAVLFKYNFGVNIGSMAFWGYTLLAVEGYDIVSGTSGSKLQMIKYDKDIDQENFVNKENKWRGGSKNAEVGPV